MALIPIKTIGGEMVDAIAHEYYKGQKGATEVVLNANPGLAGLGPVLPAGVEIILPDLPKSNKKQIKLWD